MILEAAPEQEAKLQKNWRKVRSLEGAEEEEEEEEEHEEEEEEEVQISILLTTYSYITPRTFVRHFTATSIAFLMASIKKNALK